MDSSKLYKIEKKLSNIMQYSLAIMLIIVVSLAVLQVLTRYFISVSIIWIEEVSIIALSWMACIGTPWMWLKNEHISMDVMNNILSEKVIQIMDIIINLFAIAMGFGLIKVGTKAIVVNKGFVLSLIRYDESYRYYPLVLCGILWIICAAINIVKEYVKNKEAK